MRHSRRPTAAHARVHSMQLSVTPLKASSRTSTPRPHILHRIEMTIGSKLRACVLGNELEFRIPVEKRWLFNSTLTYSY